MVSAALGALRDGLKLNSVQPIQTQFLESILVASFTITTLLLIIPCEFINGSPVPTLIFAGLPSTFQAFVVCLVFAFAGSLSALLINDSSFLVKFCSKYRPVRSVPADSYRKMGGPRRILTGIPVRLDFTSVSADPRHVSARI
ncbi:hypothetical protein ACSBR1_011972 [Camellia fascicularis]